MVINNYHKNKFLIVIGLALLALPGRTLLQAQTKVPSGQDYNTMLLNLASSTAAGTDWVNSARLLSLAGDVQGAANAWGNAAKGSATQGNTVQGTNEARVNEARCFLSMGEWDKAAACLRGVGDTQFAGEASFLRALAEAWQNQDPAVLNALVDKKGMEAWQPAILFSLYSLSGNASYAKKLSIDYPTSPEGLIILSEKSPAGSPLSLSPAAFWLLPATAVPGSGQSAGEPSPASPATLAAGTPKTITAPASSIVLLQTGLFSKEANARAQRGDLERAGFTVQIQQKQVSGKNYWAVMVESSEDKVNQSILALKDAGYESYPVY
jgi:hypothetical protein